MIASRHLFGTDGIRAPFGREPLDRRTISALALALGSRLRSNGSPPEIVLGGDTRESTPEIFRWLAAGLAPSGTRVRSAGVVPTPAVAFLAGRLGATAGIAVSASHNPVPDNGVKLIDGRGFKWLEADEAMIERELLAHRDEAGFSPPPLVDVVPEPGLAERYLDHLASTLPAGQPLEGLRLVVDCGHGAASGFAGALFAGLGAQVDLVNAAPDGRNINAGCGSTHPEFAAARVQETGADLGIAFDGDADRCILIDPTGEVRDGDAILYLWARDLAERGRLPRRAIVATSMSNLGLSRALARDGIDVVRCEVGDRAVVETMTREGIALGGEQSGHIVGLGLASTGDGLLTALQVAGLVARSGRPLTDLLAGFRRYPQTLRNVRVRAKTAFPEIPSVAAAASRVERTLGDDGRLVLRYSGTEPLARIMIEGADQAEIEALAEEIAFEIEASIGI